MFKSIQTATGFVSRNLTVLIFAVMLLGLTNSYFFGGIPFNLAICAAASFLMIYPMFINLKIEDVAEVRNFKAPVGLSIFINFILSPLYAFGLGALLLKDQPFMALGLMLIALIPTSGMTATWTERAKGNLKVALSIITTSLLVVIIGLPLILPVVGHGLLNASPLFILQRIMLVIVVPLILGDITRRIIVAKKGMDVYKQSKPLFAGLSSTGLLMVLFLIMSLSTNRMIIDQPLLTLKAVLPLALYYLLMFGTSSLLARFFPKPVGIALVYGTSVRYLALALGIAVPLLGHGTESSLVVFMVALAFFIQVPLSSYYAKIAAKTSSNKQQ